MLSFLKKWAPIIAAALVIWSVMTFANGDFLYRNGDLSLFIFGVDFLSESLNIPGGALSWLESFFTQFLLIPWLGALLWVIMLFLAAAMTVRTFGIPSGIRLGYGIYAMRAQEITTVTQVCSTVLAIIVISCFWFKDASFSAELKMSRAVDNCDWQKVVDIFDETITRESGKETTVFNNYIDGNTGASSIYQ